MSLTKTAFNPKTRTWTSEPYIPEPKPYLVLRLNNCYDIGPNYLEMYVSEDDLLEREIKALQEEGFTTDLRHATDEDGNLATITIEMQEESLSASLS